MNKLYCLIGMFFTCGVCEAQNLVPNGDFEQYISCPTNQDQLDSALFWKNPTIAASLGGASPDYFNQCSLSYFAHVPNNNWGWQQAHSGNGYAGIITWFGVSPGNNWREYLEVGLFSPLTVDSCYHFEMFVCLGEASDSTTNAIGVYFSDTLISGITNYLPLPFIPQISNSLGTITDTLNWTLISGDYVAHGGESYLLIGNYKDDSNTPIQSTGFGWYNEAYFYIDDVSLMQITNCNTIVNEFDATSINVYPNPVTNELNVKTINNEHSEILLYDITSRKILQQSFTNSITINTEQLSKGIYLYEVRNKNGVIKKGKVVKD